LRVAALALGQGTKYRVAGLPHRRFLSDAWFDSLYEHSLNDWRSRTVPERTSQGLHRKPYPAILNAG
jgi:hypothetical protein